MADPDPPRPRGLRDATPSRAVFSARVADAAPILIGYLDRQQRYRFVNRAYEQWFGVDRAQIEGRTHAEVIGPEAYDRVRGHVECALAGQRVTFEGELPYRDGATRHIEAQYVPEIEPGGQVAGYCVLVTDISARKRDEAEMARLLEHERRRATTLDLGRRLREEPDPTVIIAQACETLGVHLHASHVGYGELDPTVTHIDIVGEWRDSPSPALLGGRHVLDSFGPDMANQMRAGRETVVADVTTDPRTAQAARDGAYAALRVGAYVTVPLIKAGRLVSYFYIAQDVARAWTPAELSFIGEVAELTWSAAARARAATALQKAQETERLLVREVDHRAKNVLAVVQSLAQLTPFVDKAQYVAALSGRIGSLARSHSLLSSNCWTGARLDILLRQELEAYDTDSRVTIDGPAVLIRAEAAQSLGLVVHELATNAGKYGALSTPTGVLEVSWRWEPERRLVLTWRETGGPRVAPPRRRGFGATLIENAGRQVGARIEQSWPPEGLACQIVLDRGATPFFGTPPRPSVGETLSGDDLRGLADQRVLVVEDEALVAMELTQILTAAGAQVIGPAGDIEGALALVEAGGIDRALLDINLSGRRVTPVASALALKAIPFVYLTGYQEPDVDDGAVVLRKPASSAALLGALAAQVPATV